MKASTMAVTIQKKFSSIMFAGILFFSPYCLLFASEFIPIGMTENPNNANIHYTLGSNIESSTNNIKPSANNVELSKRNGFLSSEAIKLDFTLQIAAEDIGIQSELYLVAIHNNLFYMRDQNGQWLLWDSQQENLQASIQKKLLAKETLSVLNNEFLFSGEYLVYSGYKTKQGNINYNLQPAAFIVSEQSSAALHQVKHDAFLNEFLNKSEFFINQAIIEDTAINFSSPFSGTTTSTSQTNLQEVGVDEADSIKTQDNILFALQQCTTDQQTVDKTSIPMSGFVAPLQVQTTYCLNSYQLYESPAFAKPLAQKPLATSSYNKGQLFLSETSKQLIHISSSMQQPIYSCWFDPTYWQNNNTSLEFFNISEPNNMISSKTLSIEGALISSRKINDQLYLITRKNHNSQLPIPLNTSPLPTITFSDNKKTPLVDATDCYIPASQSNQSYDGTIITITRLDINNPDDFESSCIIGNIETAYVSTEAIYLASSRYPYSVFSTTAVYDQNTEYSTDIHKFSLIDKQVHYAASGTIAGHLGWEIDKKPFRMGENKGILKVATSLGDTWDSSSRTRVSVLKENSVDHVLEEISFLDNLGKPGEQLFAARFIGDRGYLVTFRQTDPLYLLDFSQPEVPKILGELNIEGYSDYLHPIGDNYLLGIGKDAIASNDATRGAWYQGVKVSLFDVSNGDNLHEVQSIVIGKRGSSSPVLTDHHALAWLASDDPNLFKLAIPIDEHSTVLGFDSSDLPSAYYDWTQSGAYLFDITTGDNPSLTRTGELITESKNNGDYKIGTYNDRVVLQGNALHFIHNNTVFSENASSN